MTKTTASDRGRYTRAQLESLKDQRDLYPLPQTFSELFGEDGKLLASYNEHRPAQRAILRYARRANRVHLANLMDYPPGIRQALKAPPTHQQIVYKYPWAVKWVRRDESGRLATGYKRFTSLGAAIVFHRAIVDRVPTATILSRTRSYDVPPSIRGRIPKPFSWCPRCMKPRKFQRDDERTFSVNKKVWSDTKQRYVWKERTVVYLVCPMCGCNNRDPAWRRSNQPWEKRRFKKGVRRAKRR